MIKFTHMTYLTLSTCLFISGCTTLDRDTGEISPMIPSQPMIETQKLFSTESDVKNSAYEISKYKITRSFTDASGLNEVMPNENTAPRAFLLMTKNFEFSHMTKRAKNLALCEGFMDLPFAYDVLKNVDSTKLDDQLITYMFVKNIRSPLPINKSSCKTFIDKIYDYSLAESEINKIFGAHPKGKAPYIVLVDGKLNSKSNLVLSLGSLSAESIKVITQKWPSLIEAVYINGSIEDPIIGISMAIDNDPDLVESEKQALRNKISILTTSLTCGAAIAGTTITYASLLATPACKSAIVKTAAVMGYSSPV